MSSPPPRRAPHSASSSKPAGLAAWREIGRRGRGLEWAHFQIVHTGVTLAVCSRLRGDGFIVIEIGIGDPRQAARAVTAEEFRQAEARTRHAGRARRPPG